MMSDMTGPVDDWQEDGDTRGGAEGLVVRLDAYEGPIEVLLDLARSQKIDLREISILDLVKQYLTFVDRARELRLEIAADYIVMASWMAMLKSRLLIPLPKGEKESAEQMAEGLAFQLQRLSALKSVTDLLMKRKRLGIDWFGPGHIAESGETARNAVCPASLRDLLAAYVKETENDEIRTAPVLKPFDLASVDEALKRLERILGSMPEWSELNSVIPSEPSILRARSQLASHFVAALELAKSGRAEIRQDQPFSPIFLRRKLPFEVIEGGAA